MAAKEQIQREIRLCIRETMQPGCERSYLFLVFCMRGLRFRGYFLNPYTPGGRKTMFTGMEGLKEAVNALRRETAEKELNEEMIRCYNDWIAEGLTEHATMLLFLRGSNADSYTGRAYSPRMNQEQTFDNEAEFEQTVRRMAGLF